MLDENGHAHTRFWSYGFKRSGFQIVLKQRITAVDVLYVLAKKKYVSEISSKLVNFYLEPETAAPVESPSRASVYCVSTVE